MRNHHADFGQRLVGRTMRPFRGMVSRYPQWPCRAAPAGYLRAVSKEQPGNQTPNTPRVSESELAAIKVDELRERANDLDISGTSDMRKPDLAKAVARAMGGGADDGDSGGYGGDSLRHVSWDEWSASSDERRLNFICRESRSDGSSSNFSGWRIRTPASGRTRQL